MLIASSIVMIMGWSDVFILGFYVSESEIGVYSTAIKIATIVSFTYNAIATIATPKIAEYYENSDTLKLKETISFSSKLMLICGLPIFILLMVFPEFFLGMFGEEYLAGKDVLRILICAQMTNVITGPVGPIFQMTNNQNKLQLFILISLICNLVISLVLVNYYSVIGVALGSAIGMILWNLLGAIYLYKKLNLKTWASF
jgi:O-antigen/teichoic acid export membrane protein